MTSGGFLTDLPVWLAAAGVPVVEYDGWADRARSSGGFASGRPWGVMWHHTASTATPEDDAAYCCHVCDYAPVCNLLVARDGVVWVLAAGATNTNGSGGPWTWSRGTVPADAMNTHAVSIEIANSGIGEPYPAVQLDSAFAASIAVLGALELAPGDVCTHHVWAPDRKIDPATAGAVTGAWVPAAVTASGTWSLADLIAEHENRWHAAPVEEAAEMLFRTTDTADSIFAQGVDMAVRHVTAAEGAIAFALDPGWADGAPTLTLPADVTAWLSSL